MADYNRKYMELRTILVNLECAQVNRNWEAVDRATQRLAELTMAARDESDFS
jgi:hypothetical protein